jgi:hypothetical protein
MPLATGRVDFVGLERHRAIKLTNGFNDHEEFIAVRSLIIKASNSCSIENRSLSQQRFYNLAVHVGQAIIAPLESVSQFSVLQTEQV